MSPKLILVFALCFLVGAGASLVARAALHRPYQADPAPAAAAAGHTHGGAPAPPAPAAPTPAAGAGTGAPPEPAHQHGHDAAPATEPGAIGNRICPGCGMEVDPDLAPVATAHGTIAIGCRPCAAKIARDPATHAEAARENRKATP